MKLSEITSEIAANYLRQVYSTMTAADKLELDAMVAAAKSFVKYQTGLENISPKLEVVGTGDGVETEFTVAYHPASAQTVYVDGVELTETEDYTFNGATGLITFVTAPAYGAEITASYSAVPSDAFEDLAIAGLVLISDMYDNRSMTVDRTNVNKVVESIMGMHQVNLL